MAKRSIDWDDKPEDNFTENAIHQDFKLNYDSAIKVCEMNYKLPFGMKLYAYRDNFEASYTHPFKASGHKTSLRSRYDQLHENFIKESNDVCETIFKFAKRINRI